MMFKKDTVDKLADIQSKLRVPKSQFNNFGKYRYRSCEDILEALKPILDGAVVIISDDVVNVSGDFYVKATAKFIYGDGVIEVSAFAREPRSKKGTDESQVTGSASSYARKYALNGLFAIDDTKDSDATNDHGRGQQQRPQQQPQKPQAQQQAVKMNEDVLGVAIDVIGASETVDALKEVFANSWKQTGCANQRAKLKQAYDSRLAQLKE